MPNQYPSSCFVCDQHDKGVDPRTIRVIVSLPARRSFTQSGAVTKAKYLRKGVASPGTL